VKTPRNGARRGRLCRRARGHAYLIEVGQRNNDGAFVEILDPMNEVICPGLTTPSRRTRNPACCGWTGAGPALSSSSGRTGKETLKRRRDGKPVRVFDLAALQAHGP